MVPPCHEAARKYLQRGWSATVFCPVDHLGAGRQHCRVCSSPGKVPIYPWKDLQTRRLPLWHLDRLFISHPNANVGVILGPISGLIGIDIDGEGGKQLLREVSKGELPKTLCFSTGRGWRLLYSLADGEVPPTNRKLEYAGGGKLEILAERLPTVMPPSKHESGKVYQWISGHGLELTPAPTPGWVYRVGSSLQKTKPGYEPTEPVKPIESYRNERLFRMSAALRRHGVNRREILEFLRIVNKRCVPPLEEAELRHIARSVGRYQPVEA